MVLANVTEAGLELLILLSPAPKCWNYRNLPSCPPLCFEEKKIKNDRVCINADQVTFQHNTTSEKISR